MAIAALIFQASVLYACIVCNVGSPGDVCFEVSQTSSSLMAVPMAWPEVAQAETTP